MGSPNKPMGQGARAHTALSCTTSSSDRTTLRRGRPLDVGVFHNTGWTHDTKGVHILKIYW